MCRWQLHIDVPKDVTKRELAAVVRAAIGKKGGKLEGNAAAQRITLEKVPRGRFGRALHVGPYDASAPVFGAIAAAIDAAGYDREDRFIEVYLNDPNRVGPEKTKTICLLDARSRN